MHWLLTFVIGSTAASAVTWLGDLWGLVPPMFVQRSGSKQGSISSGCNSGNSSQQWISNSSGRLSNSTRTQC